MKRSIEVSGENEIDSAAARWVARRDLGLSPEEVRELQRWLAADPRHDAAFRFYGSAWSALARPARLGAGAKLQREVAVLRLQSRIFACAAMLVVMLGVSIAFWISPRVAESSPTTPIVSVPTQQRLPDGSVVELKDDARVVVDYSTSVRRARLQQGEAHFTVHADPARPFIVSAGNIDVRAVGTAFSVQLGAAVVDVLVTDGRVAVDRRPSDIVPEQAPESPFALVTVDAGKRVVVEIESSSANPVVSDVPPDELQERLAWRSALLEFTRTPLVEAITLLNQHAPDTGPQLVIGDAILAEMRLTGVFRASNTDAFVRLLEGAFDVRVEPSGNSMVLRAASSKPQVD